jgi:hypothetical protein
MNSRALTILDNRQLKVLNSITEFRTRYHSDLAGAIDQKSIFFYGKALNAAVSAALSPGMGVIMAGIAEPATGETGQVVLFDKCPPGGMPDGMIEIKEGDYLSCRILFGDMEMAGAVNGADYVIGTDGRPAKQGDSTFPTSISTPAVFAIGWLTNRIMLGMAPRGTQLLARAAGKTTADSSVLNAAVRTDFDKTFTIDPRPLRAGDELEIKGLIKLIAPALTTFQLWIALGPIDVFVTAPLDPVDAGDQLAFSTRVAIRAAGDSGKVLSGGEAKLRGDVAGANCSGGGIYDETSVDLSLPTITVKASGAFSVAGANTAILRDFQAAPVYRAGA